MEFANNEVYTFVRVPLGHPKMEGQKKLEQLTTLSRNRKKTNVLILNESL